MEQVDNIPEIQELKGKIELGESLERLKKNKDFKRIVDSLYIEGGLENLARNLPVARTEEIKGRLFNQIEARGVLLRTFHEIEEAHMDAIQGMIQLEEEGE